MVRILILVGKTEVVKNKEKKLLGWQEKKRNKINV